MIGDHYVKIRIKPSVAPQSYEEFYHFDVTILDCEVTQFSTEGQTFEDIIVSIGFSERQRFVPFT